MKITTVVLTNNPAPQFLRDTFGIAFTGMASFSGQVLGFPYALKPANLTFYYKYAPSGNDSAYCSAYLFKWNTANSERDTLAEGFFRCMALPPLIRKAPWYLIMIRSFLRLRPTPPSSAFRPATIMFPCPEALCGLTS